MGINGLLPVIKPICQQRHVQDLAHTRVGIDVYGWLHKGAFACALNLCRGIDTSQFVQFCMHRIRMLIHFKVTPILVFDGADLPMKAHTHNERRERREEAMRKAEQAFARGDKKKAEEWYQRAYTVTSEMARLVIRECRKINVQYVVAPYEADAQLAWMMKTDYIDGVITEDSDMLVYGATKILFKMNRFGNGDLYESRNLLSLDSLNMNNFTQDMFMYMAVCSGCDFFKGVQGLGVKKSHAVVKRFRSMKRLILAIRQDRRYKVQKSFAADFSRACLVFRHQTVFDMHTSQHVHLNELCEEARAKLPHGVISKNEDGTVDLSFLGIHRDTAIAKKIAEGLIHPRSLEEYMDPLDIVSRPVTNRVRPRSFPSPLKRRRVQAHEKQKVRGFQVQPASANNAAAGSNPSSGGRGTRYSPSLNLRRRLTQRSNGAQSFNPRRVGAAFRAKHGSAAGSSGIWASFKSSRDYLRSPEEPSRLEQPGANDGIGRAADDSQQPEAKEDHFREQKEDQKEESPKHTDAPVDKPREQQSPQLASDECEEVSELPIPELPELAYDGEHKPYKDSEPSEHSKPGEVLSALDSVHSPKRRRVTSSHRVEAVNRAIGRFAQPEKKDVTKKFISVQKPPSSPEDETCNLLADMDAVLARPEEPGKEPRKQLPKKVKSVQSRSQIAKRPQKAQKPKTTSQVRLSRFFPPRKESEKDGTSKQTCRSLAPLRGTEKNPAKLKLEIQKARNQTGSNSLNKYKLGAVGRTAVARRKKL